MATAIGVEFGARSVGGPYEHVPLGLTASLPSLPNLGFPVVGRRLPHGVKSSIYLTGHLTATSAQGTGIKVGIAFAMDPNTYDADLGGTNTRWDAIIGPLTSGTSTLDDTALASSTAVAATASTLPTSVNVVTVLEISLPNADNNSLTTDEWFLLRVRRLGDNALDTNLGSLVVFGISVYGY